MIAQEQQIRSDEKILWSKEEVAERLGVSVRHVYRLVQKHGLPCVRQGRTTKFIPSTVEKYFLDQEKAYQPTT